MTTLLVVSWLAGIPFAWAFILRAMATNEARSGFPFDRADWVAYGVMAVLIAPLWPLVIPFMLALRKVRQGFERDMAASKDDVKPR